MERSNYIPGGNEAGKGQKIAAALYLVTAHLPERDPLRSELRECAVDIAVESAEDGSVEELKARIVALLNTAAMARLISETNKGVIEAQLDYLGDFNGASDVSGMFAPRSYDKGHLFKRTSIKDMSFTIGQTQKPVLYGERKQRTVTGKSDRQEAILSFINERKSATIKDISSLFPSVSEKTIQRELSGLVAAGRIRKQGNKRWSLYLPA